MSWTRSGVRVSMQCRGFATLRDKSLKIDPKNVYEPKFEDPRIYPDYKLLNVRLQSYDYVPLEKYQSFIHKIAKRFNFSVSESYGVAAQTKRVVLYRPNSTVVESEMDLVTYDRVLRIADVPTAHLPVGVKLTVKQHEKADEDYRYIPDLLLKQQQDELKSLDDPLVRKALGWE